MTTLILATSNPGKLQEMKQYFDGLDWQLKLKPAHLEVEETGTTFLENACLKASVVAQAMQEYAIADDSGLSVTSLGGAPGIYSARYGATDALCIERLLRELGDSRERDAQFICTLAVAAPDGTIILTSEGICQGTILKQPLGEGGFGYDPVFYVPQYQLSFAQMAPELKNGISHRGQAFAALLPALKELGNKKG